MLWIKSLHIIFMVTWFSGLFYLPRLFVYHALSTDPISQERFKIMERKLYYGITTPGAILTILFGVWMLADYGWALYKKQLWLHLKLGLVFILILYHIYCGYLYKQFKNNNNRHSHIFYRWLNEFPILILFGTVIMAIVRPF